MDINVLRSLVILLVFFSFIGLCLMVFSRGRKAFYENAAKLPFAEDDWQQEEVE